MTTGRYPACPNRTTDRMPAISRRECSDYTTLSERIAEREGERARVAALNREMRRQVRSERPRVADCEMRRQVHSEWPLGYWINWAIIVTVYLAGAAAVTLTWGMK